MYTFLKKDVRFWLIPFILVAVTSIYPEELSQKKFFLKNLDPQIAIIQIQPLLGPSGKVEVNQERKELLLTDFPANIEKIGKVIEGMDLPQNVAGAEKSLDGHVYPDIIDIKAISASAMYSVLKDVFGNQIGDSGYNQAVISPAEKIFKGSVKIHVMPGDQSLMVMANVEDNRKVRDVISKIEANKSIITQKPQENSGSGLISKTVGLHNITSAEAMDAINKLMNKDGRREGGSKVLSDLRIDCLELKSINSILVVGSSTDMEKVLDVIHKMDTTPMQVLIEVTILEVTLANDQSLGFEWWLKKKDLTMQNKYGLGDQANAKTPPPGFFVQYSTDYLQAVMKALEDNSNVKVLSSPHAVVANNKKAVISIGDSVVINKESIEIPTGNAAVPILKTTHEYVDVGLKLEIFPKINDDGLVSLDITQDVNDIKDSGIPGFPTISKRNLTTSIISRNKELVVLGGLINRKVTAVNSKIPLLGYLPVIGRLFRNSTSTEQSTELVLFLTPTIIKNQSDMDEANNAQRSKMESVKRSFFSN